MAQAWVNFARTGDQSFDDLSWPPYEETKRETMIFDVDSYVISDPDREVRAFFNE